MAWSREVVHELSRLVTAAISKGGVMLTRAQIEVFSQAISQAFGDGFRDAQKYRNSTLSPEA